MDWDRKRQREKADKFRTTRCFHHYPKERSRAMFLPGQYDATVKRAAKRAKLGFSNNRKVHVTMPKFKCLENE